MNLQSSSVLYEALSKGENVPTSVMIDYYGVNNLQHASLIEKIYKGLFSMGVTPELLEKYFRTGKLDELIHTKHRMQMSKYYQEFVKKRIEIGSTPPAGLYNQETGEKLHGHDTMFTEKKFTEKDFNRYACAVRGGQTDEE